MKLYQAGDRPGEGVYRCGLCGRRVTIHDDQEELPACFQCGATNWIKVK